jgi:hypothetical protein
MINAESVKAKLKNQALKRGDMLHEELTTYGLERTIYRVGQIISLTGTFLKQILHNILITPYMLMRKATSADEMVLASPL